MLAVMSQNPFLQKARDVLRKRDDLRQILAASNVVASVALGVAAAFVSMNPSSTAWIGVLVGAAIIVVFSGIAQLAVAPPYYFGLVLEYEKTERLWIDATAQNQALTWVQQAAKDILRRLLTADAEKKTPSKDEIWTSLEEVLGPSLGSEDALPHLFSFERGEYYSMAIYLLDDSESRLHCAYRIRNFLSARKHASRSFRVNGADEGHIPYSFRQGKSIRVSNIWAQDTFKLAQPKPEDDQHYTSVICVPLFEKTGRVNGVICLSSSNEGRFQELDKTRVELLANLLAPMLKGVRLSS